MGTASTMALCSEALGMMLPGSAAIPAVMAERMRNAEATGARAVAIAKERLTPDKIMTPEAFENALRVLLAVGGSTNAIVHFAAIAGRLGFELDLDAFDRMGRETPVLVDLKPTGQHYMEHLYEAGGLATILRELKPLLHGDALTINGKTLLQNLDEARVPGEAGRRAAAAQSRSSATAASPCCAATSRPTARSSSRPRPTAKLMTHTGRAVVFESLEDLADRIDDPRARRARPTTCSCSRTPGPKARRACPKQATYPIPRKLAQQGVKDMVRISDARMSGTAFGSIVLHVAPESAVGGPLALVRNGDRIRLDVPQRRLELLVDDAELAARRKQWRAPRRSEGDERGYRKLFLDTVQQADRGCDFDFLAPKVTMRIPRTRDRARQRHRRFESHASRLFFSLCNPRDSCQSNGSNGRRYIVRRSKIHGRGVFALTDIPKGTRLMEYLGERITHRKPTAVTPPSTSIRRTRCSSRSTTRW